MSRVFLALLVAACNPLPDASGFPDRGDDIVDDGPATVDDICLIMDSCDLWFGPGSCETGLTAPDRCPLSAPYLACMNECVEADTCLLFSACEDLCFDECQIIDDDDVI